MNRKQAAAVLFNPFSIMLLGGVAGLVDNVLHLFLGRWGDALFAILFGAVALMLTPLAREYFAYEKAKALRKKKPNLGLIEWFAIVPTGVLLALGLDRLWTDAVKLYGPNGNLLFLTGLAGFIGLLLFLDLKRSAAEDLLAQAS